MERVDHEGASRDDTTANRVSDTELVVTRTFNAPPHRIFQAWTQPELFRQWWVPTSSGLTLVSCEIDVRPGGSYRLEFRHPTAPQPMAFFGTYSDVVENVLLVWTNEESPDGSVTTVTFEDRDGKTLLIVHDRYPSKAVLDAEIASGSTDGMRETLEQLGEFLLTSAQ